MVASVACVSCENESDSVPGLVLAPSISGPDDQLCGSGKSEGRYSCFLSLRVRQDSSLNAKSCLLGQSSIARKFGIQDVLHTSTSSDGDEGDRTETLYPLHDSA